MKNSQLVEEDQPIYKLKTQGASVLTNRELLYLILGEAGNNILQTVQNNLKELGKISLSDIMKNKGIGETKASSLIAAIELGKRRQISEILDKPTVKSSRDIAEFLKLKLQDYQKEVFAVLFLNRANKINHFEIVSEGGITGTVADPRVILKLALEKNAVNIILSHNHPSGNLRPSRADEQLTTKIKEAARYFDISVLDHIIVSEEGYYSFVDDGLI